MSLQTALIVDDSKSARFGLRKMLEKCNLSVELCESAEQAIQYLENQKPDVIFMDHIMPGMDGFEATKAIKAAERSADIPVIMCTSKEGEEYEREAASIGAFCILPKPANMAMLRTTFDKLSTELGLITPTQPPEKAAPAAVSPKPSVPSSQVAAKSEAVSTSPAAAAPPKDELERIVASQLLEKLNELKAELIDETAAKASEIAKAEAVTIAQEGAKAASELVNAKLSDFSAELTELSNHLANLSPVGEGANIVADLDVASLKEELREMAQSQAMETSRSEALQAAAEQIDTKLADLSGQVENRLNLIIQQLEQQQAEHEAGTNSEAITAESIETLKSDFSTSLSKQVGSLKNELVEKLVGDVANLKSDFAKELTERLESFKPEPGPDIDSLLQQQLQSHGDQLQQQLAGDLEEKFERLKETVGASASMSDGTIAELKQQVSQVLEAQNELKVMGKSDTNTSYETAISELKEQVSQVISSQAELKELGGSSSLDVVSEESVAELKAQVSKLLDAQGDIRELASSAEGVDMDEIKVVADSVANEMFDTRMEAVTKELKTDVGGQLEDMKAILNSPRPIDPEVLNDLKSMMKTTSANEVKKAVEQAKKELIKQSELNAAAPVMSDVVHGPSSWRDNAVLFGAAIIAGGLCAAGVIFLVG